MVGPGEVMPERDMLTDPLITGKKPFKKEEREVAQDTHKYQFRKFDWLANEDGFNYPIDVKYGTIYLGLLVDKPEGFIIKMVDTPTGKQEVKLSSRNKFKSENEAADALHKLWKWKRVGTGNI
jgi:hypothetical protein